MPEKSKREKRRERRTKQRSLFIFSSSKENKASILFLLSFTSLEKKEKQNVRPPHGPSRAHRKKARLRAPAHEERRGRQRRRERRRRRGTLIEKELMATGNREKRRRESSLGFYLSFSLALRASSLEAAEEINSIELRGAARDGVCARHRERQGQNVDGPSSNRSFFSLFLSSKTSSIDHRQRPPQPHRAPVAPWPRPRSRSSSSAKSSGRGAAAAAGASGPEGEEEEERRQRRRRTRLRV